MGWVHSPVTRTDQMVPNSELKSVPFCPCLRRVSTWGGRYVLVLDYSPPWLSSSAPGCLSTMDSHESSVKSTVGRLCQPRSTALEPCPVLSHQVTDNLPKHSFAALGPHHRHPHRPRHLPARPHRRPATRWLGRPLAALPASACVSTRMRAPHSRCAWRTRSRTARTSSLASPCFPSTGRSPLRPRSRPGRRTSRALTTRRLRIP